MASTVGKLAFLVGANVSGFNRAMGAVSRRITALQKTGIGRTLGGIARGGLAASTSLLGLGAGIGSVAAAGALFQRGMNMEEVERSFQSLARSIGSSGDTMLGKLRAATRGSVNDYDLMLAANNAVLLGVAKSADQYAELASKAMVLGQGLRRGPVEALNDITIGIGRQSRMILDNLGLLVSIEKANDQYAASIGKTADQLTDAEQRQAFFNATLTAVDERLASLPATTESARTAFGRLSSSILNIIDHAMVPVVKAASPFVAALAAKINAIPLESFAGKVLKAFGLVAKVLAWIVDNVGLVVAAFGVLKMLAGAIGTLILGAFTAVITVADAVVQLLGGEGFRDARDKLNELAFDALEITADGFMDGVAGFDQVFFGGRGAQDFVDKMIAGIDKGLTEGFAKRAAVDRAAGAVAAGGGSVDPMAFAKQVQAQLNVQDPVLAMRLAQQLGGNSERLAALKASIDAEAAARGIGQAVPYTPALEEARQASEMGNQRLLRSGNAIQQEQLRVLQEIRDRRPGGTVLK